jgi:N-acetylmuramoyl-L-alanine amidase
MRFGGYMVGLALAAAVAGLGLGRDTEGAGPFDPVGGVAIPDTLLIETEVRDTSGTVQEAPPQEAPSTRSSWRSRRNRYPGPIPTPEEWEPPPGPVRIGVQVGHWKTEEAPRELSGLRGNGTRWQNKAEWEVNLAIAQEVVALLEEEGYEVDLLPAVVPPSYRAHLFIAIHADGSNDPRATGFRVAAPRRDATGRASDFVTLLEESYGKETGLRQLPDVTRRMRSYYAFNFRRYEHALHPMTIGVILETGFLTSARDRAVIMDDPGRSARGIVEAVKSYEVTPSPKGSGGL